MLAPDPARPRRGGGEWAAPDVETTDELQFVFDRGLEHEKKYLASLVASGKSVAEIETAFDAEGRRRAEETVEAMRRGVDVVYQGTFFDGAWGGQADFLLRVETPAPVFGDWSYEIADTKLARKLKVAALLQMATYAERLSDLQGVAPEFIHVATGDGESRPWRLIDVAAYARRARGRLETFVAAPPATGPSPIGYCEHCRWAERCNTELRQADDQHLDDLVAEQARLAAEARRSRSGERSSSAGLSSTSGNSGSGSATGGTGGATSGSSGGMDTHTGAVLMARAARRSPTRAADTRRSTASRSSPSGDLLDITSAEAHRYIEENAWRSPPIISQPASRRGRCATASPAGAGTSPSPYSRAASWPRFRSGTRPVG
ncbi:hypothetical protein [Blastococcus mobilis]|uniref:hypothetical protein n=1 Tax=Blastococcus mobilis TaxID=1938746 RepID=UPI000B76D901|nr:hypothetical protein [Blastococcus mobilis]